MHVRLNNLGIASALSEMVLANNKASLAAHYNLAVIDSMLAGAKTAVRAVPPKSPADRKAAAQGLAMRAISHAREATALGAVPPLADGYWKKVSGMGAGETGVAVAPERPFELEPFLQPGGAPIMLETRNGVLPTSTAAAMMGFDSPGAFVKECARMCHQRRPGDARRRHFRGQRPNLRLTGRCIRLPSPDSTNSVAARFRPWESSTSLETHQRP
jgi:hypothetical protein